MKRRSAGETAMTLIEVLVVIAVVAIVLALVLPMIPSPDRSPSPGCLNNLRQIDIGFLMYTGDNEGRFPMQFSITNGGTMEFLRSNQTFPHYQKLSQYFTNTGFLVCPGDKSRQAPVDYKTMGDTNLSYFLNADVSTNNPSNSILAGDRDLEVNSHPVPPGLFSASTNLDISFSRKFHLIGGGLAFADGHVEFCRTNNLNSLVHRQNLTTFRLSVP
jgi:prepilin-type N-terminal cleavage/methylation domain-containing protein/prepilin-type processing-associated H-X9-DG protein